VAVVAAVAVTNQEFDSYAPIDAPSVWLRSDLLANKYFVYSLTSQNILEIEAALNRCAKITAPNIIKSDFKLPQLSKHIDQQLRPQINAGIGVLLLKGLNASDYTLEELTKIHWGLGLYFGKAQQQYGKYILKVENQGYRFGEPKARNTNTASKLWFHNDSCDVTVLMCIREAKRGGDTQIVSATAIHNKIKQTHPDLLKALYQPYYRTYRHISGLSGSGHLHAQPIFTRLDGQFSCNVCRPVIDNAQKHKAVPRLSQAQVEALDMLEKLAEHPELCHDFFLDPGDIIYMNNNVMLHARKAFEDDKVPEKKRLLLRLHLSWR